MMKNSTPIPNAVFDLMLPQFTESELKVYLIITRKTIGWFDGKTGKRKERDWIATSQFQRFTGLSNVSIWKAVDSLAKRHFIFVSDGYGNVLYYPHERKGRKRLYYQVNHTRLKII